MITPLGSGLLLSPFVFAAGYIIHSAPICRLWWSKSTGYNFYFRTITAGLFCFFLSYLLVVALDKFNPSSFYLWFGSIEKTIPFLPLVAFGISHILRTIGGVYILAKQGNKQWKYELDIKTFIESSLTRLATKIMYNKKLIAITLNNNKVYVGWPSSISRHEDGKWLRIIPVWSGYRDEKYEIQIQEDYTKIFGEELLNYEPMLIAVETIIIVQPFDKEIYDNINRAE